MKSLPWSALLRTRIIHDPRLSLIMRSWDKMLQVLELLEYDLGDIAGFSLNTAELQGLG